MAEILKRAREAKRKQDEERIRKQREEWQLQEKQEASSTPPQQETQAPPVKEVPMEVEKPKKEVPTQEEPKKDVPVQKEEYQEAIKGLRKNLDIPFYEELPPKRIELQDLFLIPPSFHFSRPPPKEKKNQEEEDMKTVRIAPVPVKQPSNANPTHHSKKRPRSEPSSESEEDYSSEEEVPKAKPRKPSQPPTTRTSVGSTSSLPPTKQTNYLETIGGMARKALTMVPVDTSMLGQNVLFFLGSVGLVIARSEIQRRFSGGYPMQTIQPPASNGSQNPTPHQNNMISPPIPSMIMSDQWSNYAK